MTHPRRVRTSDHGHNNQDGEIRRQQHRDTVLLKGTGDELYRDNKSNAFRIMTQQFEFQIFGGRPTHHSRAERVYYYMDDSLHSRGAFGCVFPLVDPVS